MTSRGYPGPHQNGFAIHGLPSTEEATAVVFHAGTARRGSDIVTAGGRVLGVTGCGKTIADAQREAYRLVGNITFDGCHFRTDIAYRALRSRNDRG
jgi:phosphoribosylamine--glycine ligase